MKSYVQFLTTPTADTRGTTLLLHFDSRRYLIGNVGEGTQRAGVQAGARLIKTSCIFLTGRTEWANVGGLLGMILTLADSMAAQLAALVEAAKGKKRAEAQRDLEEAKKGLQVVGPANLTHMFATSRRFIFRQGMPIKPIEVRCREATHAPFWEDENIRVWAFATAPEDRSGDGGGNGGEVEQSELKRIRAGMVPSRKRSFDEFRGRADAAQAVNVQAPAPAAADEVSAESLKEHDEIRQGVVSAMFDSDWRLDHLIEMPLGKVQLPAALFIKDPDTNRMQEYKGPMPSADPSVGSLNVWVRRPWPGALVRALPPTKPAKEAVSYIFRNHPQRGKFLPQKAEALGVTRDQYKPLTFGQSVTTADGRTVLPEDVMEPSRQGSGFAVIDVPSVEYVAPTLARQEWKDTSTMTGIKAFIWILGPGVVADPALQSFFNATPDVKHIVTSVDVCPNELALESVAGATQRLHEVDPERYVVPIHDNETLPQASFLYNPSEKVVCDGASAAQRGMIVNLEPIFAAHPPPVKPPAIQPAASEIISDEVKRLRDQARLNLEQDALKLDAWAQKLPCPDAEVVTLGTGSALPSKYRNVSATLIRVPGIGSYLLDCGENTLGQLQRMYSPAELVEILKELRMIWISHLHADHHLGTTAVIKAWYQINHPEDFAASPNPQPLDGQLFKRHELEQRPRLAVISDTGMLDWLAEYARAENFGHHMTMPLSISNASITARSELSWAPMLDAVGPLAIIDKEHYEPLMGFTEIQAVGVRHCHGAKAVSVTFPNSFKFSYSGDCRPNKAFARIGKQSTVLIHEATFDDELQGEAIAKQHSTTSEALAVASDMRAKSVVLTHFSQRYQKIPVMEGVEGLSDDEEGDVAGDSIIDVEPVPSRSGAASNDTQPTGEEEDAAMVGATLDMASDGVESMAPRQSSSASAIKEAAVKRGVDNLGNGADIAPAETSERAVPSDKGTVGETHVRVKNRNMKVCVAFDYMRVRVGDIAKMEYFTPALMKLFEEPEKPENGALEPEEKEAKSSNGSKKSKRDRKKGNEKEKGAATAS